MTPSPWVLRFAGLPAGAGGRSSGSRGTALDVAAGSGRHTRVLAGLGYAVTAVDRDVRDLAGLTDVAIVEADLENGAPPPFAGRAFDLVVVTNYLHRPLLPALVAAVGPGGALVYETFARGNERYGRPSNPEFLLDRGELLAAVGDELHVVAYEDAPVVWPRPAVVQRIAATRCRIAHGNGVVTEAS